MEERYYEAEPCQGEDEVDENTRRTPHWNRGVTKHWGARGITKPAHNPKASVAKRQAQRKARRANR